MRKDIKILGLSATNPSIAGDKALQLLIKRRRGFSGRADGLCGRLQGLGSKPEILGDEAEGICRLDLGAGDRGHGVAVRGVGVGDADAAAHAAWHLALQIGRDGARRARGVEHVVPGRLLGRVFQSLAHVEHAAHVDRTQDQGEEERRGDRELDGRAAAIVARQEPTKQPHCHGTDMVTDADTDVGGVQLPNEPKLSVDSDRNELNVLVVVTVTYFLRVLVLQVVEQETVVPFTHSQNTELLAVTPVRPVALTAVELMPLVSLELTMPYCAPSRAPCNRADFCSAKRPRSIIPESSRKRMGNASANSMMTL